jgi:hypothetical protein
LGKTPFRIESDQAAAMFFFSFGLPGRFAEWCDAVAAELARRALGPTELIRANTLEELALGAMRSGASLGVVSSRQPGGRLRAALVENRRNFIVALDDPAMALAGLVLDHGVELAAATQAVASSCAALSCYRSAPGALILQPDSDWPQQAAAVAAIARHLQAAVDDAQIVDLLADLAAGNATRPRQDTVAWWNGLAAADREMAAGALAPYLGHQASGGALSITWARDLFFLGDRPDERAARPVDITGRARCLVQGPHIMLPPGPWSLSLTMLFSREAAEHEFLVEICTDHPLASDTIRPQQAGSAAIAIDFALGDSTEHPVAVRVSSVRAAFDGAITMVGATLVRAASPQDAPATFLLAGE